MHLFENFKETKFPRQTQTHLNGPIHFGLIFWGEDGNIHFVGGSKFFQRHFGFFPLRLSSRTEQCILCEPGRLGSNVAQLFPIPELETGWFDGTAWMGMGRNGLAPQIEGF